MSQIYDMKCPDWLGKSVDDVAGTEQWNSFLGELQDAIEQQMAETDVQKFTDLSEAEKVLLEERGLRIISGGDRHNNLFEELSRITEANINAQVNRELQLNSPYTTRAEAVHYGIIEGIASLLYKWPDLKHQFVRFLNQPLPSTLRPHVWRVCFSNEYVLEQYQRLLHASPQQAISIDDYGISERCKQILTEEPSLKELHGSTGSWYAMKAVLSYYHARKSSQQRLTDSEILLMAPFLQIIHRRIARHEPPDSAVIDVLVQEYFTFMNTRPIFMIDSGRTDEDASLRGVAARVLALIRLADEEMPQIFGAALAPGRRIADNEDDVYLAGAMLPIMRLLLKPFFVGILSMDALLFLWDQYVICSDMPKLQEELVAVAVASYFLLMKAPVKAGANLAALEKALKTEGLKLRAKDFQYLINRHFFSNLHALINFDLSAPLLDPAPNAAVGAIAGGRQPSWRQRLQQESHEDEDFSVEQREKRRLQREADKQRIHSLQQQLHSAEVRLDAAEEMLRIERQRQAREEAEELARQRRDREYFEEQWRGERARRLEDEQRHEEELRRLRMERQAAEQDAGARLSTSGGGGGMSRPATGASRGELFLFPPPPSRATHYSPLPWYRQDHAIHDLQPEEQVYELVTGFIGAAAHAANKACHGTGAHTDVLNDVTRLAIVQHTDDMRDAERQVFGRELKEGELDDMDESDRRVYTDRIMQIVIRQMNARRQRDLDNSKKY